MTMKCPRCNGSGKIMTPLEARNMRVARKLTLAQVSTKMGISIQYLSDLEKGKRDWDRPLEQEFIAAVKSL